MLSQTDLLSLSAGASSAAADLARLQYVAGEPRDAPPLSLGSSTVGEAMAPAAPLVSVLPAAPLPEAAALMLHHGVHTLPVVEPAPAAEDADASADEAPERDAIVDGLQPQPRGPGRAPRLLGAVSRTDILRAVLAAAEGGGESAAALQQSQDAWEPPGVPPRSGATPWRAQRLEEAQPAAGARRRRGSGDGDAAASGAASAPPARRFYEQAVEAAPPGHSGFARTVRWGRVGGTATQRALRPQDCFATFEAAAAVMEAATRAKLRRGYALVSDESGGGGGGGGGEEDRFWHCRNL